MNCIFLLRTYIVLTVQYSLLTYKNSCRCLDFNNNIILYYYTSYCCFAVLFLSFSSCRTHSSEDNIENKITVSSCNCDVHVTCLQQRQSVTNPYCFKMVEGVTIFEWLPEGRNCPGFCQEFTLILFSMAIWCSMLIACGVKAVGFFLEANDQNSFPNGIVMTIIAFSMAAILWLWLIIFSSIWKRMDVVIRMNKNCLNVTDDINSAFAV